MLPSGPLRATNASRNSINFFSSGTCDATASGAKSAKDLKLSSTGSSAFSSSVSLFFTVAVIFSSLSRITASKLFLSTVTVARSSNGVCSACPLKSPTTRVLSGSSTSACASPVAGIYLILIRSLGATLPSLDILRLQYLCQTLSMKQLIEIIQSTKNLELILSDN
ncbi:Uncharacterised protein [Vibrio cholerae]|nr:Uncharacterised protein [Vibrio cholerae]